MHRLAERCLCKALGGNEMQCPIHPRQHGLARAFAMHGSAGESKEERKSAY